MTSKLVVSRVYRVTHLRTSCESYIVLAISLQHDVTRLRLGVNVK
jgi:hypothetical protein